MMVRLKQNVLVGGKTLRRHSLVELNQLPEKFRGDTSLFETQADAVLVLRELSWQTTRLDSEGVKTSRPASAAAGAVISLGSLPQDYRQTLIEGTHYKSDWTVEDQHRMFDSEEERFRQAHSMEPPPIVSPQGGRPR
jgi:hypothetical protein